MFKSKEIFLGQLRFDGLQGVVPHELALLNDAPKCRWIHLVLVEEHEWWKGLALRRGHHHGGTTFLEELSELLPVLLLSDVPTGRKVKDLLIHLESKFDRVGSNTTRGDELDKVHVLVPPQARLLCHQSQAGNASLDVWLLAVLLTGPLIQIQAFLVQLISVESPQIVGLTGPPLEISTWMGRTACDERRTAWRSPKGGPTNRPTNPKVFQSPVVDEVLGCPRGFHRFACLPLASTSGTNHLSLPPPAPSFEADALVFAEQNLAAKMESPGGRWPLGPP